MHEDLHRKTEVSVGSERSFGIVFAVFFALIGLWPLFHSHMPRSWALVIGAGFLAAALFHPGWLRPFNRLWFRFGMLLHAIVNPLVMGLIYFVTVVPIGLLMRALGKDPLRLKRDPAAKSYWIERRPPGPEPDSLKNQF